MPAGARFCPFASDRRQVALPDSVEADAALARFASASAFRRAIFCVSENLSSSFSMPVSAASRMVASNESKASESASAGLDVSVIVDAAIAGVGSSAGFWDSE